MSNSQNSTGHISVLYPWFVEHGLDLIHESDRDAFQELSPYGKVFTLGDEEGEFVRLSYGSRVFLVKLSLIQRMPAARYQIGDTVLVSSNSRMATIEQVQWHLRDGRPFYILRFENKHDSRRYSDGELSLYLETDPA